MEESNSLNTKRRRKGVRNDSLYKRNRIRNARVKGNPYINYKNKAVAGKTLKLLDCR